MFSFLTDETELKVKDWELILYFQLHFILLYFYFILSVAFSIAVGKLFQGNDALWMSYDKKLNTDTIISRSGLDYRTHSTEDVNCVTLERSRPSKTERQKERKKEEQKHSICNCSCAWRSKTSVSGKADGLDSVPNSSAVSSLCITVMIQRWTQRQSSDSKPHSTTFNKVSFSKSWRHIYYFPCS